MAAGSEVRGKTMIKSDGFTGVDGNKNGFRFSAAGGLLEAIGAVFRDLTVRGGTFDEVAVKGEIKADTGYFSGELRAADGTFIGTLQAASGSFDGIIRGTLDAKNLISAGSVVAGTAHLIKGNNAVVYMHDRGFMVDSVISVLPVKYLRLFATGNCTLRIKLPYAGGENRGSYAVKVNGSFINVMPAGYQPSDWFPYTYEFSQNGGADLIREHNITLANLQDGNLIELFLRNEYTTTTYYAINSTFELRCGGTQPGLIGLLG